MSDWTTLTVADRIEESTDRIVDAIDRLTMAIIIQICYNDVDDDTLSWAREKLEYMKEK